MLVLHDGSQAMLRAGERVRHILTLHDPWDEALETPAASPGSGQSSELMLELRPLGIATIYLELVPGRKVARNLDAYRSVWASVHSVESGHDLPYRQEA